MFVPLRRHYDIVVGLGLCAALSGVVAVLFASRTFGASAPLVFVAVILALALRYGATVGIFGSVVAAFIFSTFLFEPFYSLRVQNTAARANIGWMLLAGIALSHLLARPSQDSRNKN